MMPAIQTLIDVVVAGAVVGVLLVIMAVVVNRVEADSSPQIEAFSESDKMIPMRAIAENDVVFCRTDAIGRKMEDDTVYLLTPSGRVYDQITAVDCDVDQPVYCNTEDISKISSYLESCNDIQV